MDEAKFQDILQEHEIFVDDPLFYEKAFALASRERRVVHAHDGDNFKRACAEEFNELSERMDKTAFQESCSARNVFRSRRLANLLISDKGDINTAVLPRLIDHLKHSLYSLGPNRQYDGMRQKHMLTVFDALNSNKELVHIVQSITRPISHKYAEQMIRDTLLLPGNVPLTDAHARRAVLAAWLCTLRQNVGSCFATAPAIVVHDEQPAVFLKDLRDLLSTGRLKRTFGGIEYSVPLSPSWGAGDLKKSLYLPTGDNFAQSTIWLSPGLESAFEAAEIIDKETPVQERLEQIKGLLSDLIGSLEWNQPFILISVEEIIRKVILRKLGLTEQDLSDYESRPRNFVPGGILIQAVPKAERGGKSKGELCTIFYNKFKAACNAFKALCDNALLKCWEFTLASFAETKAQFTRWNLYASLGLGPQEAGGIGAAIFEKIKVKLEQANQRVKDFQYEYEQVFHQLKTMESRMRSVSTEREAQWLRTEYQTKRNEFYTLEEIRDGIHSKAQKLANLFDALINQYDALFPLYFQEVYDADMHDVSSGPYDDSPAGFRLLYKYGRSNTAQWSLIKTPSEYIDVLTSFFTSTETEITSNSAFEGLQSELTEIVTAVVSHVRTKEFLETSFYRMATAHQTRIIKDPLEHLDRIEKKPWAYTSGGTMGALVSCYFRLESPPTEVGRWVESPLELLVFFVDTLKQISHRLMEPYISDPGKSMIIHSPTHAFLLKPGLTPFKEAWQSEEFSYTYVRDHLVAPRKKILESISLDADMMRYLIQALAPQVPENYRFYFLKVFGNMYGAMSSEEFRNFIIDGIQRERGLKQGGRSILTPDEIDSLLYSMLPLFPYSELKEKIENIYAAIPFIDSEQIKRLMGIFELASRRVFQRPVVDASTLQNICKGLLCLDSFQTSSEFDYHTAISAAAQQLEYAMPAPILFADSNWVKDMFGFVVNPGTGQLELWRVDATGRTGVSMSSWEQWLNGSRQDRTWGIYTRPYEYNAL